MFASLPHSLKGLCGRSKEKKEDHKHDEAKPTLCDIKSGGFNVTDAVLVDCLRTPVGKANRGALRNTRPDDLAATAIRALLARLALRGVIKGVLCVPFGGEVARQRGWIRYMPAPMPVSSPTRATSSSTAVHSSRLTPANRPGAVSRAEKIIRTSSSAMPWNRLMAGSSRLVCSARWAKE